jgi:hypothetical protein
MSNPVSDAFPIRTGYWTLFVCVYSLSWALLPVLLITPSLEGLFRSISTAQYKVRL